MNDENFPEKKEAQAQSPPRSVESEMCKVVGGRLRRLRERRGWALSDVARYTGIPMSTISEYELGSVSIPSERLGEFAKLYAVSTDWLLTGREVAEQVRHKWPEGFSVFAEGAKQLSEEERGVFLHIANYLLKYEDLLRRGHLPRVLRAFDKAIQGIRNSETQEDKNEEDEN